MSGTIQYRFQLKPSPLICTFQKLVPEPAPNNKITEHRDQKQERKHQKVSVYSETQYKLIKYVNIDFRIKYRQAIMSLQSKVILPTRTQLLDVNVIV